MVFNSKFSNRNINNFYGFFINFRVSCHYFRFLNNFLPSISVTYSGSLFHGAAMSKNKEGFTGASALRI
jgi:hypothetical protein